MKIYSMTATFGKLEHETLVLEPGLNIIHAPNEWGKSTWCAFLAAMLFGLETRAKSTKTALADKERYRPWSGDPMAGRMDISWNGREITIERKTGGRVPLGEFRAYETASGLPVPELTAANCGEMLLGVERSVFLRSGFIRFRDLPVTEDEALRHRLNALVTTGDEGRTGEKLAKQLRELKNSIRYNRTGLLPRAEEERQALREKLQEMDTLLKSTERGEAERNSVTREIGELENHRAALAYAAAQADARQVENARKALEEEQIRLHRAEETCEKLPAREKAEQVLTQIERLQTKQSELEQALHTLPEQSEVVEAPKAFAGLAETEILDTVRGDGEAWVRLRRRGWLLLSLALLLTLCGGAAAVWHRLPGLIGAGVGLALTVAALLWRLSCSRRAKTLANKYGASDPEGWLAGAESYLEDLSRQQISRETLAAQRSDLESRLGDLNRRIYRVTNGESLEKCRRDWLGAVDAWKEREAAQDDLERQTRHYHTLKAMARIASAPEKPDCLTLTASETAQRLSECAARRRQLEHYLGTCQGAMAALGSRETLENRLKQLDSRIAKLEETYGALTLAQETLAEATAELQRRFAPRIAQRAKELMAELTGGRYSRVSLDQNLALRAGTEAEDTLREILWRSDGTVDQLYLALRLAVAEELTPGSPLVLDDALVRFDDRRLRAALDILARMAEKKQVLLFTCHNRERMLYEKAGI